MDFSKVDKAILVRYQRRYNVVSHVPHVDLPRCVERHFDNMEVNEEEVIAKFFYSVFHRGKSQESVHISW
jgi:hypothetical protein